ncbi:hypothetical protein BHE90_016718 [Fusarium euwallaceae]|uniref:Glycoside hydrolase family 49 C-terminal domain-containing protein n=1 Tax=Fusarium euwallaceae TaxID=1147111 RepID=A0A430KZM1_9HYPO|nr:hypothetical protein BHE90_016718 [Fusarium euwallaceae]
MGWKPRGVSGVTIKGLNVIHTRWFESETGVPSAIIGASPNYQSQKFVDTSRTISGEISDITCEGHCPALLRIAPLQNYDLSVKNVKYDALLKDENVQLGQSLIGMKISDQEDIYSWAG